MLFEEQKIRLKNGKTAVFRSPAVEDAEELLDFLKTSAGETPFLLRTPGECTMTKEQEQIWISGVRSAPNKVAILCQVEGKIAGNCEIVFHTRMKLKHRASIGISLLREFWNLGIGTAMFQEMIRLAKAWPGITQMELEVMEGNRRAIHLYEKMGFRIVAARPNAFRLADGTMQNELIMVKDL